MFASHPCCLLSLHSRSCAALHATCANRFPPWIQGRSGQQRLQHAHRRPAASPALQCPASVHVHSSNSFSSSSLRLRRPGICAAAWVRQRRQHKRRCGAALAVQRRQRQQQQHCPCLRSAGSGCSSSWARLAWQPDPQQQQQRQAARGARLCSSRRQQGPDRVSLWQWQRRACLGWGWTRQW